MNSSAGASPSEPSESDSAVDVLTTPWTGPYGGVPPWDQIDPDGFGAAFDQAIAEAAAELETIASNPEPATFDNTIVALEQSGRLLSRVASMFGVHTSNLNVGPIPDIQREVGPKLAAHSDSMVQNTKLFERIQTVHQALEGEAHTTGATESPAWRLTEDYYRQFIRQGARLGTEDKARLSAINQELAGLFTEFAQNVLQDEANLVTWVADETRLDGLPNTLRDSLASAAADRGRSGSWAILNSRSSMDPVLTYATNRDLREEVWRTYYGRGDGAPYGQNSQSQNSQAQNSRSQKSQNSQSQNSQAEDSGAVGNPEAESRDNKPIITEILRLRAERAQLLGYETHAHWRLEVAMAKTPETAMDLMLAVWPKARDRALEEVADMQRLADREAAEAGADPISIEPWDYRFYAEKVRKEQFDLDFNQVKPYLQLEKLVEAMLWCSNRLFGLDYTPVTEVAEDDGGGQVPIFHPDVRVWRVTGHDGRQVGLWYLDPYAREGKLSGAWMTAYRSQESIDEPITTLVSNNSNFVKGKPGEPILISWDDARTLFHEFGHALHGLLSNVSYPSQSGTAVSRDYVEFPSQLNEHWLMTDEVLNNFCRHYQTDEPMPTELVERIKRAENFNQGFDTVEYLASALVDMRLHLAGSAEIDPAAFERDTLADLGMPEQIVMRHRIPQFAHVFSGDSYSAGYYSYLWADALTADAAEAFEEGDGFFDPVVAGRLHDHVFSVGDTIDPGDGFRAFRGRDVDTNALLRKRGFPVG